MARGFAIIEVLIVLSMVTAIAGLGLFVSTDVYRSTSVHEERTALIALLERARSHAMHNLYDLPHGVCHDEEAREYVVFSGTFASESIEERVPEPVAVEITGMPVCGEGAIMFSKLHGTSTPHTLILTGEGASFDLVLNREGLIEW